MDGEAGLSSLLASIAIAHHFAADAAKDSKPQEQELNVESQLLGRRGVVRHLSWRTHVAVSGPETTEE